MLICMKKPVASNNVIPYDLLLPTELPESADIDNAITMDEHVNIKEDGATNIEHQPAIIGEKNATSTEQGPASIGEENATNAEPVKPSVMPTDNANFAGDNENIESSDERETGLWGEDEKPNVV